MKLKIEGTTKFDFECEHRICPIIGDFCRQDKCTHFKREIGIWHLSDRYNTFFDEASCFVGEKRYLWDADCRLLKVYKKPKNILEYIFGTSEEQMSDTEKYGVFRQLEENKGL